MVEGLNSFLRTGDRRAFLKLVGIGSAAVAIPAVLTACSDDPTNPSEHSDISLANASGAGNLMYAMLQLNADFAARVTGNKFVGMTAAESTMYTNLSTIWTAQRNLLQNVVTADRIGDALLFDFTTIDFSNATAVRNLTITLTELLVSTGNGVVGYNKDASQLLAQAKIHSVSGRMAAYVRDTINTATTTTVTDRTGFASTVTASTGMDATVTPSAAYTAADPYFLTTISISGE